VEGKGKGGRGKLNRWQEDKVGGNSRTVGTEGYSGCSRRIKGFTSAKRKRGNEHVPRGAFMYSSYRRNVRDNMVGSSPKPI
jgi:hypothetical protein